MLGWFNKELEKLNSELGAGLAQREKLTGENLQLKQVNKYLKDQLSGMVALYEITKNICKSLIEEKVFALFKDELVKYLKIDDCRYLKGSADLGGLADFNIVRLEIDKKPIGYLAAKPVKKEDEEIFHILSEQFSMAIKRAVLYQRIQELAVSDALTGTFSRRHLLERFNQEIERSIKFGLKFSFLMIDIDNFKSFNDKFGHLVGDVILREVSEIIKQNLRQIDLVGRLGGDELAVVLVETDRNGAMIAAQRIRQAVEKKIIRAYDEKLKATISIGIAESGQAAVKLQGIMEEADSALYQAKSAGRNRVSVYGQPAE